MVDAQAKNSATVMRLLSDGLNCRSVPHSYIQPLEKRPTNLPSSLISSPHCNQQNYTSPIVDLEHGRFDRAKTIQQIFKAIEEFGFFQLINHGISKEMMGEAMSVGREFFEMPMEDREKLYCDGFEKPVKVASSVVYDREDVHYWRDSLRHVCYPVEESTHFWPLKPPKYREVVAAYSEKVRALALKLLELIADGLGLKSNYFDGELTQMQTILVNHYPQCPDPSLTLGLPVHKDPTLITLLLQDLFGLQVLKDGEWMGVQPLPGAFVVILGFPMQIICNDKLKAVEHRVLTNSSTARTTITTQVFPTKDCTLEPIEELIDDQNPPKYRTLTFQEYFNAHMAARLDPEETIKPFKLH
ncbi:hypothetical protein Sjap_008979 [Stephania japonica]|uniref:Fe2OG dioxygenase domain-containing protein n=1 Tax=Stephania japonica TaxID=461633 RepID=A0AAP0PF56_9MAGN